MTSAQIAKRTGRPTLEKVAHKQSVRRQRARGNVAKRSTLPEYLEAHEIYTLMAHMGFRQKLLMQLLWRAGLRVSEALALDSSDFRLDAEPPHLRVKMGKGGKERLVPMHPDLVQDIKIALDVEIIEAGSIFNGTTRQTAWGWVKTAQKAAESDGTLPTGRKVIATHTFRHSAARHWLANGVQINVVSRWLGHASLQTTLPYLEILPDPMGYMERIP